jgi:DNA ligase D-like protein (predicted 3'-phosphoesterase)
MVRTEIDGGTMRLSIKLGLFVILLSQGIAVAAKKNELSAYHKKRNFKSTPEPKGKVGNVSKKPIFVIQKHDATSLHYDFRLQVDGVLASWAVPKGPSTDPRVKRLAMRTENHPLEYANFEGVIPEGNYGAGPVMVWDYGTYKNINKKDGKIVPMEKCIENGEVEIWLNGKKLKGGYVFILINKKDGKWLLKKIDDDEADARRNPESTQTKSALSGRTLSQIKKNPDKIWNCSKKSSKK